MAPFLQRLKTVLFCCLTALSLSSCIEGLEEVWIEANGSSRVCIDYKLPKLTENQIRKSFDELSQKAQQVQGVQITKTEVASLPGDRIHAILEMTFESPNAAQKFGEVSLNKSSGSDKRSVDAALAGDIDWKLRGLIPEVTRTVFLNEIVPFKNSSPRAIEKNRERLQGAHFRYKLHLPNPAHSSNAHLVSNQGRDLEWHFLLADQLDQAAEIRVAWMPTRFWVFLAGLLLLTCLIIYAAFRLWKKRKSSRAANLPLEPAS